MKAFVIKLKNRQDKEVETLRQSIVDTKTKLDLNIWEASEPDTIKKDLDRFQYLDKRHWKWTWPTNPSENGFDLKSGVYKFMYQAAYQEKKVATSLSHVLLWDMVAVSNKPIVIFEADALMTRKFEQDYVKGNWVVGLNDPRGATRRASVFDSKVYLSEKTYVQEVPTVNESNEFYPQGLAGNSAYYIEPDGARELLDKVKEYGMWPNDAYMCKELFPWIRVTTRPYFTRVQGIRSTTVN